MQRDRDVASGDLRRESPPLGQGRRSGSDDRVPKKHTQKRNHKNPNDKAPVLGPKTLWSEEASRSLWLMRNLVGRPPAANLTGQALVPKMQTVTRP